MILLTLYGWHLAAVIGFAVAFGGLGVWWAHTDIRRAMDEEERRQDAERAVLTEWPRRPR